jgi:hypothetical protein
VLAELSLKVVVIDATIQDYTKSVNATNNVGDAESPKPAGILQESTIGGAVDSITA